MDKKNLYLVLLLEWMAYFFISCFVIIMALLLYNPKGLVFLGDLVPLQFYIFPVPLIIIIFHTYLLITSHVLVLSIFSAILIYSFHFTPILIQELRIGRKSYRMSKNLRSLEAIQHVYRCLQVLHANVFGVFGLFLVICNATYMVTGIFYNFALIKYWNQLQLMSKSQLLLWNVMFMTFWASVLELGRFLFSKGHKVLSSWKGDKLENRKNYKVMKKFLKSCKPIVLSYGKQFVIGRVSIFVFFRGVVRGTARALLTTKN